MLGLFVFGRLLYRASPIGRIAGAVERLNESAKALERADKLARLEVEQELGINSAQTKWEMERYGQAEGFRPFIIEEEDLPAIETEDGLVLRPMAIWAVTGPYIFKLSEYKALMRWMDEKTAAVAERRAPNLDVDGFWLIKIGRERWRNDELRKAVLRFTHSENEKTS